MSQRIHNFSAGPAVLPVAVLEAARDNLLSLGALGMGIMEISHRSKEFTQVIEQAVADARELLDVPDNYHVLFIQGGATLQFSMVPMNLLGQDRTADYINTGAWSDKAIKEARKIGSVHVAADGADSSYSQIPAAADIALSEDPAYLHFTSNNTIFGTQWASEPAGADGRLVVDASSDIMSRPLDVTKYALIYAGAQKNLGPSGVALVIVRDDVLERSSSELPTYLNYRVQAEKKSLYNTPNTWGIYFMGLVFQWIKSEGGLSSIVKRNHDKATMIYDVIDSGEFYSGHATPDSRSQMNLTFRLPNEVLEAEFVKAAAANGMSGLKGHRSVGGMRASIYNACPLEASEALAGFMRDFATKHG